RTATAGAATVVKERRHYRQGNQHADRGMPGKYPLAQQKQTADQKTDVGPLPASPGERTGIECRFIGIHVCHQQTVVLLNDVQGSSGGISVDGDARPYLLQAVTDARQRLSGFKKGGWGRPL